MEKKKEKKKEKTQTKEQIEEARSVAGLFGPDLI